MKNLIYNKIKTIIKTPLSTSVGLIVLFIILYLFYLGKITETGLIGIIPAIYAILTDLFKENINKNI